MGLVRFKKLCVDANNPELVGQFWAAVLGRAWKPYPHGEGGAFGPTPQHTVWINRVPEPKVVRHRMHVDIYARSLADLEALGSTVVRPEGEGRVWTVMADPEGGEYCAFLREELPAERMHGLVVDSADPAAQARWWSAVFGADLVHHANGVETVTNVPGMPILTMDFARVPEPKSAKNRVHPDLVVPDIQALVDAGATILRAPDGEIDFHVMADPEGNEFCAFGES